MITITKIFLHSAAASIPPHQSVGVLANHLGNIAAEIIYCNLDMISYYYQHISIDFSLIIYFAVQCWQLSCPSISALLWWCLWMISFCSLIVWCTRHACQYNPALVNAALDTAIPKLVIQCYIIHSQIPKLLVLLPLYSRPPTVHKELRETSSLQIIIINLTYSQMIIFEACLIHQISHKHLAQILALV